MSKRIEWTPQARADIRHIDRQSALSLLEGLADYVLTGYGDVERLQAVDPPELRLRLGDYRIRFYDHGEWISDPPRAPSQGGLSGTAGTRSATTPYNLGDGLTSIDVSVGIVSRGGDTLPTFARHRLTGRHYPSCHKRSRSTRRNK